MAVPVGAQFVQYNILLVYINDSGIELNASGSFRIDFEPAATEVQDAFAQEAADLIVQRFQEAYPDGQVIASRAYQCRATGDPWPPPPEEA